MRVIKRLMPFRFSQPRYVIQIRRFVTRVRSSSLGNTRQRLKTSVYKHGTATNLIDLEDTRQRRKHAELYPLCVNWIKKPAKACKLKTLLWSAQMWTEVDKRRHNLHDNVATQHRSKKCRFWTNHTFYSHGSNHARERIPHGTNNSKHQLKTCTIAHTLLEHCTSLPSHADSSRFTFD